MFHLPPLEKIECWEKKDPDKVNEVPVEAGYFDPVGEPLRLGVPHFASRSPEVEVDDDAAHHVQPMESGEREVRCVKQIFTRHDSVGELSAVFEAFYQQEQQAAQNRKPHVAFVFDEVFKHQ